MIAFRASVVAVLIASVGSGAVARAQATVDARTAVDTAAVGAQLSIEHIQGIEPWVMLSAHRTFVPRWGTAAARLTLGERFGQVGIQGEVEAYPRVARVGYLYVAAALSPNENVFIPRRAALELFNTPTPGLELSLGTRFFHVSSRSVFVYTGSIGAYRGNYWYAFRPYFVRLDGALSRTGQLSVRRYWAGRYDYVGVYLAGTSGADPTADDPSRLGRAPDLTTFSVRVERLRPFREGRVRAGFGVGFESEEVAQSDRRVHVLATFRMERLLR